MVQEVVKMSYRPGKEQLDLPTPQLTVVHLLESASLNDEQNFPLKLADKEKLLSQLHTAWKKMLEQTGKPQILVVDFSAIGEIPAEIVREVLAYNHCAFEGRHKMFAVYDQLRDGAYKALSSGFKETGQVVAVRPAGLAYTRLLGCESLIKRFDVPYAMLANESSWVDGDLFSTKILRRGRGVLDDMSRAGIVMRMTGPNNRILFRAVQ